MNNSIRILAFAGSTRKDSVNKKLIKLAATKVQQAGATVSFIDLAEYPLPLYDQDLETAQGMPAGAAKLKRLMIEHDAFMIASPEYNSSISGVLKNVIDWVSRPAPQEAPLIAFKDKVVAIMSASPSVMGGLRGLVHLRSILGNIGVLVLPDQLIVPKAMEAFNPDGTLRDTTQQIILDKLINSLITTTRKLKT